MDLETPTASTDSEHIVWQVVAVDIQSGNTVWQKQINDNKILTLNPRIPVIVDDLVLIHGIKPSFIAFDADSGDQRWIEREAPAINFAAGADGVDVFYGGVPRGELVKYNVKQQSVDWTALGDEEAVTEPPAVTNDTVYAAVGPDVVALDRESGEEQWRKTAGVPDQTFLNGEPGPVSPPVITEETVYVSGSFQMFINRGTAGLTALNRETGDIKWTLQETDDGDKSSFTGLPIIRNDTILISGERELHAISIEDRSTKWTAPGYSYFHVGANGLVYVVREDERDGLTAYDMTDGSVAATLPFNFYMAYTPTPIIENKLLAPTLGTPGGLAAFS